MLRFVLWFVMLLAIVWLWRSCSAPTTPVTSDASDTGVAALIVGDAYVKENANQRAESSSPLSQDTTPAEKKVSPSLVAKSQETAKPDNSLAKDVYGSQAITPLPSSLATSDAAALLGIQFLFDKDIPIRLRNLLPEQHIVRKLTALLGGGARNQLNNRLYEFADFKPVFRPTKKGNAYWLDDKVFSRYDRLVDALTAIDPKKLVSMWRLWQPLIQSAYVELGTTPSDVNKVLDNLLKRIGVFVPLKQDLPLVHMYGHVYRFVDEELDKRSKLDKLFIRLGPRNTRVIQAWAGALSAALNR